MPAAKTLAAAATFGLALSAGSHSIAAQTQQSESSVQSNVRDLRDSTQRTKRSNPTHVFTGTPSAGPPPRPQAGSEIKPAHSSKLSPAASKRPHLPPAGL